MFIYINANENVIVLCDYTNRRKIKIAVYSNRVPYLKSNYVSLNLSSMEINNYLRAEELISKRLD